MSIPNTATVSWSRPREGRADAIDTFATAPEYPTAVTGEASGGTETEATLNATVNPNGFETECEFEYGETRAYGSSVPCSSGPLFGSGPVDVSARVTDLTVDTTYHFRIVGAPTSSGTGMGNDQTFIDTGELRSGCRDRSGIGSHTDHGDRERDGKPQRGKSANANSNTATTTPTDQPRRAPRCRATGTSAVAVSASVTGLAANTTYHFRISATNAGGTSKGSDETFTDAAERPDGGDESGLLDRPDHGDRLTRP